MVTKRCGRVVALAELEALPHQVGGLVALFDHEEDVDRTQRTDRLHRDLLGMAGADADHEDLLHGATLRLSSRSNRGEPPPPEAAGRTDSVRRAA
jgi:hypothetical protein